MKIGVLKELPFYEKRVAIVPDVVAKLNQLNFSVLVEKDAGLNAGFSNSSYNQKGADIFFREQVFKDSDIIVSINGIDENDLPFLKPNHIIIANFSISLNKDLAKKIAATGVEFLSLDFLPRISRAQSMDVLSSQNNLAGYKAVLVASNYFKKSFPLMMTAAGMIPPAKIFVMGAGVAGLQAIATAKRLGALVTAYDVRVATKEQVESLGAKFVIVDEEIFKDSESKSGYAKELSSDYKEKEKKIIFNHIIQQDIVISTALIPGKKAPLLIDEHMVQHMLDGSVIVDLAASNGGNCEVTQFNKVIEKHGVTIVGYPNLASEIPMTSSILFANNLFNMFKTYYKDNKQFSFDYEDEIIKAILIMKNGTILINNL